jgi:hypothetical protein
MKPRPVKFSHYTSGLVFGELHEIVHDTYHCEDSYDWPGEDPYW